MANPKQQGVIATGSEKGGVWLWFFDPDVSKRDNKPSGKRHLQGGHTQAVCCVQFSPEGRLLASGSTDRTYRVWDVSLIEEPILAGTVSAHESWVRQLRFSLCSSSGPIIVTGSVDGKISFWALPSHLAKLTYQDEEEIEAGRTNESMPAGPDPASTGSSLWGLPGKLMKKAAPLPMPAVENHAVSVGGATAARENNPPHDAETPAQPISGAGVDLGVTRLQDPPATPPEVDVPTAVIKAR